MTSVPAGLARLSPATAAKALGRYWRAGALTEGPAMLRSPIKRARSLEELVSGYGGKAVPYTQKEARGVPTETVIYDLPPAKEGGKPQSIMEFRANRPDEGGLDVLTNLDEYTDADYYYSPLEQMMMAQRAQAEGKTGWNAFNTAGLGVNTGVGGKFYRQLFESMPTLPHARVMATLSPSNVAAQGERFRDQAIRNIIAGDVVDPFAGMYYSNRMGQASTPSRTLREMVDYMPQHRIIPSVETKDVLSPVVPELGYVSTFEKLRREDPRDLLGRLMMTSASSTEASLPGFSQLMDLPWSLRPEAAQKVTQAQREIAGVRRIPSAETVLKDLTTMDMLKAMQRGEAPDLPLAEALPYLKFKYGGLVG